MNAVRVIKKLRISFIVASVLVLIFFVIGFDFLQVAMNFNLWLFVVLFSVAVGGLIRTRKKFHQGQAPIFLGVIFSVGGLILFVGAFSFQYIDDNGEPQTWNAFWELNHFQAGIFAFLVVAGVLLAKWGTSQALGASYFWGSVKTR